MEINLKDFKWRRGCWDYDQALRLREWQVGTKQESTPQWDILSFLSKKYFWQQQNISHEKVGWKQLKTLFSRLTVCVF